MAAARWGCGGRRLPSFSGRGGRSNQVVATPPPGAYVQLSLPCRPVLLSLQVLLPPNDAFSSPQLLPSQGDPPLLDVKAVFPRRNNKDLRRKEEKQRDAQPPHIRKGRLPSPPPSYQHQSESGGQRLHRTLLSVWGETIILAWVSD